MAKKYKRGEVLIVEYIVPSNKRIVRSNGIVFEESDLKLTLVHNFSGTGKRPIDITKIPLKNISSSEKVKPKEINSLEDLKLYN